MIKKILILIFLLLLVFGFEKAESKPYNAEDVIKIAVIDTGFDFQSTWAHLGLKIPKICKTGHNNLINSGSLPQDSNGHGTHIAGLIAQYAENANYCLMIIKYYSRYNSGDTNLSNTIKAFKWAIDNNADVINYSGGGPSFVESEYEQIMRALKKGIIIVAAAGNESANLNIRSNYYYPAQYDSRIIVVGNSTSNSSNYGIIVDTYEPGGGVISLGLNSSRNKMTGTSQSTAITTGKTVKKLYMKKVYKGYKKYGMIQWRADDRLSNNNREKQVKR